VLVTCSLANGKLFNPDYQIDPAAWVEQVHQERLRRAQNRSVLPERPPGRLEIRLERPDVTAGLRSLEAGLSDEASEETRQAHRFLDRLGVGK
jgi:hypothetical protein